MQTSEVYYQRVGVEEKPTESGRYICEIECNGEVYHKEMEFFNLWAWILDNDDEKILSWQKELIGYFHTKEQLEEFIGDAFGAGRNYQRAQENEYSGGHENPLPDKRGYLISLNLK